MRFRGLTGAAKAWFIAQNLPKRGPCVVVTRDKNQALELKEDLQFFCRDIPCYDFPDWETLPFEPVSPGSYLCAQRIACLHKLLRQERVVVITHVHSLLSKVPTPELLLSPTLTLTTAMKLSKEELEKRLCILGYEKVSLVEEVGEYAVRGGVLDFHPGLVEHPVRCEFLGEHVHQLRIFHSESQRSMKALTKAEVLPVSEFIFYPFYQRLKQQVDGAIAKIKDRAKLLESPPREVAQYIHELRNATRPAGAEVLQSLYLPLGNFFDYCRRETPVVLVDEFGITQTIDTAWEQITEREERLTQEHYLIPKKEDVFVDSTTLLHECKKRCLIALDELELLTSTKSNQEDEQHKIISFHQTELSTRLKTSVGTGDAFAPLKQKIEKWREKNYRIGFVVGSEQRARRLERILLDLGYDAPFEPELSGEAWANGLKRAPLIILLGHLSSGTQIPSERLSLVAEAEIFGERSYRRSIKAETNIKKLLGSLSQLKENDYVVHADYGIGIYRGFTHMEVEGVGSDLLQIEYADSLLYLPLTNISILQRFSGAEGQAPVLDKLSSQKWKKTKQKVRESVATLAGELIRLYAARSITKGWQYPAPNADDEIFADGFPYSETEDQFKAIEETLADMSTERPMDRLVCGDVGFGKTEIALRAAYKATQDGKQVAVLAPTTILVEQHKETFQKRFRDFPIRVGAVSRFYPPKKNKLVLQEVAEGKIDVILGTHKLLQRDVTFRDLGLLIVDEEHRFGVKQKEKLKQLRKDIDVLTLTATPIPRTLHMSLLDLRDISIISTPPIDRRTVRTYVAAKDETLIRDAIMRELQRSGQCFFVHNRVQSIDLVTSELKELIPEARFEYAHGQMPEHQLEKIMLRFLNHEIDVLVATTIIESGIDIPNANTMLINRADAFGLAQLYQLRGRVGRSSRQAYCYFLVPKKKKLTADAQERLRALQSLDDLGLGFNLAIRDLEIRGAGNLLGKEQSGSVLAVGFELYMKILKEAIHHLSGDELSVEEFIEPEVKIEASAFVPEYYIPDISERLILYQRLSGISSEEASFDLLKETEDRFGPLPDVVEALFDLMTFRGMLRRFGVLKADITENSISFSFSPKAPIDADKYLKLLEKEPEGFRSSGPHRLTVLSESYTSTTPPKLYRQLIQLLEQLSS